MKRRRLQIRTGGHRQPFSYDPSTGRWILTWEDKHHSGVARTVREARAAVRRATRRLVLVEEVFRIQHFPPGQSLQGTTTAFLVR